MHCRLTFKKDGMGATLHLSSTMRRPTTNTDIQYNPAMAPSLPTSSLVLSIHHIHARHYNPSELYGQKYKHRQL